MSCKCKSKISGMRRRKKFSVGAIQPAAEMAVGIMAGRLAKDQLFSKVAFISSNPLVGIAAKVGLGLFVSGQRSKTIKNIGNGIVIDGLTDAVSHFTGGGVSGFPSVKQLNGYTRPMAGEEHQIAAIKQMQQAANLTA